MHMRFYSRDGGLAFYSRGGGDRGEYQGSIPLTLESVILVGITLYGTVPVQYIVGRYTL